VQEILKLLESLLGVQFYFFTGRQGIAWDDQDWIFGILNSVATEKWNLPSHGGGFHLRGDLSEGYYFILRWTVSNRTLLYWDPELRHTSDQRRFEYEPSYEEISDFILGSIKVKNSPLSLLAQSISEE
jgi:hypothetical protein